MSGEWDKTKKFFIGSGLILLIVGYVFLLSYRNAFRLLDLERSINHSYQYVSQLHEALTTMKSAEAGAESYVITGDSEYLKSFQTAQTTFARFITDLKLANSGFPERQNWLAKLDKLSKQRFTRIQNIIDTRQDKGFDAARVALVTDGANKGFDQLRAVAAAHETEVIAHLNGQVDQSVLDSKQAANVFLLLDAVILLLFFILMRRLYQHINELDRSERELQSKGRLLNLVLDSISEGLMVCDESKNLLMFNPAAERIVGFGTCELMPEEWCRHYGFYLTDQKTPFPSDRFPLTLAATGQEVNDVEMFIRNGRRPFGVFVSVNARPLIDKTGSIRGGVMVCRDISERKRLQEQANHLHILQEREDFMAALTHDLKNPLVGADRVLDILIGGKLGELDDNQKEVLLQLKQSNEDLIDLIRNLIDIYRLERDIRSLQLSDCNLSKLCNDAVSEIEILSKSRNIELTLDMPRTPVYGQADYMSIKRLMQNLLNNALKFTPTDGFIRVKLEVDYEQVIISVQDSGPGIPEEEIDRLFERFWQGLPGKKYAPGSGLGLHLCREITEAHHGSIACRSTVGEGTTFTVFLPVHQPATVPA